MTVNPKTNRRQAGRINAVLLITDQFTVRFKHWLLCECAPVQSAGQLRGSSSLHGSGLQTSRGRRPWTLPPSPSPSPLASTPPSEAHTRIISVTTERFQDDLSCHKLHALIKTVSVSVSSNLDHKRVLNLLLYFRKSGLWWRKCSNIFCK